jgi:hypothetical protein
LRPGTGDLDLSESAMMKFKLQSRLAVGHSAKLQGKCKYEKIKLEQGLPYNKRNQQVNIINEAMKMIQQN